MHERLRWAGAAFLAAALSIAFAGPLRAEDASVESFYKGKSIDLYIGLTQGAAYDIDARLVARHMSKYIPGRPVIVPKQMTGAGSLRAVAFAANVAPHDGTVLVAPHQAIPLQQAMHDPALKADVAAFHWIGTPVQETNVLITWHKSGIRSISDAKTKEVVIGGTGQTSTAAQYPALLNAVAGTRFKIIAGFQGGTEVDLAMERGEVDGRGSANWDAVKARPGWIDQKKVNVLVQIGLQRHPDLADVPLLTDFARNDEERAAIRLLAAPSTIGHPLLTTPGVPQARVDALRRAFDLTMKDPDFLREAAKAQREINPVLGTQLQRIVAELVAPPKPVLDRLVAMLGRHAP
jgi:tripartite-type tricarboxylate transporter receptor subunit TctC